MYILELFLCYILFKDLFKADCFIYSDRKCRININNKKKPGGARGPLFPSRLQPLKNKSVSSDTLTVAKVELVCLCTDLFIPFYHYLVSTTCAVRE